MRGEDDIGAAAAIDYDEVIESQGVKIPFVPAIITPKIERPMRAGRYELGEAQALRSVLRPGDRVLELGAGVGLCSAVAAAAPGVERVVTIEANPDLIPLIRETHRLNGIGNVELRNGVAMPGQGGDAVDFFLRADFWASSMEPDSRPWVRRETLPSWGLDALIAELDPTVIVCDIEGGELGLFDGADLSRVRHLVMELHPKVYGEDGVTRIAGVLAAKGLHLPPGEVPRSSVHLFSRRPGVLAPRPGSHMPARAYRDWPIADPRVMVATCMKDEGPFILEWLAWQRAVGVTDIVVFTNDCSDGTDRILDRLQAMGELTHLPNPALAIRSPAFQPIAIAYAMHLPMFRAADFFISMDVDEFINIRLGEGRFADLFARTGAFDALSMTELNHGSNRQIRFRPGWVTEQFPLHQTETPGKPKSRRGVKTILRLSDLVLRPRNHRPDFLPGERAPLWLDGSGRMLRTLHAEASENGHDCRGTYDLVSLDHFALRSLDSYLMKMLRGDVVVRGKQVSAAYWRTRNRNDAATSDLGRIAPAARRIHAERFETDATLMALHDAACVAHAARIAALLDEPVYQRRRDQILSSMW